MGAVRRVGLALGVSLLLVAAVLGLSARPSRADSVSVSKYIQGAIQVKSAVPELKVDYKTFCNCGSSNTQEKKALPQTMSDGTYSFNYYTPPVSFDSSEISFGYRIGSTKYYVGARAYVPHAGKNVATCQIQLRDRTRIDTSPYVCTVTSTSVQNDYGFKPVFVIDQKPTVVVTDSVEQVDLVSEYLGKYCNAGNTDRCLMTDMKAQYHQVEPAKQVGRLQENCTEDAETYEVRWKSEHKETNSFGTKLNVGIGVAFGEIVKAHADVTFSYEHTWEDSVAFDEATRIKVPAGKVGGVYLSDAEVNVSGNMQLVGADKIYVLKDVNVTYPIKGESKDAFGHIYSPVITTRILGLAPCSTTTTGK
jgi:hypothetical protein